MASIVFAGILTAIGLYGVLKVKVIPLFIHSILTTAILGPFYLIITLSLFLADDG